MTDQEFEKGLKELMEDDASGRSKGKKKKDKKGGKSFGFWKSWSRRRKIDRKSVV